MKIHHLKTDIEPLERICMGLKTAEFRKNDRNYEVNDILILHAYDRDKQEYYDKCPITFTCLMITHIQTGYGIPEGYVMLSFQKMEVTY